MNSELYERARTSERLLMDHVDRLAGDRILTTTLGRAQFARFAAETLAHATVDCHLLDLYQARMIAEEISEGPDNVSIHCCADFPDGPYDVFAMPIQQHGDGELVQERIQAGFDSLRIGGQLILSTDNRKDSWLRDVLKRHVDKLTRLELENGLVYIAKKKSEIKKRKDYRCPFAFRDQGRLLQVVSRPSVFSHRRLDLGARALLDTMEVRKGDRVLDIGCGSGVLSIAAASRCDGVEVHSLDSNPRAVQCTLDGATANELANIQSELDDEGNSAAPDSFDLVLGYPPYYANDWMAEVFVEIGLNSLKPDGRLQIVTERPKWYHDTLPFNFGKIEYVEARGHHVFTASERLDV